VKLHKLKLICLRHPFTPFFITSTKKYVVCCSYINKKEITKISTCHPAW
jgi:hypothetical protein